MSLFRSRTDNIPTVRATPSTYTALVDRARTAEQLGNPAEARRFYEDALRRLAEADNRADASNLLRWIAGTYRDDADAELTLDCAEAALAVAEAHAQDGLVLVAMAAHDLGVAASLRGDAAMACGQFERSIAAYRDLGLLHEAGTVLGNLGLLHTHLGRWHDAASAFDQAMDIARQGHDRAAQMLVEVNRADLAIAQGDYFAARSASERARLLGILAADAPAFGAALRVAGIVEREAGHHVRAEALFLQAEEVGTARGDALLVADTAKEMAELQRRQGHNRAALEWLNRAQCLFVQLQARREIVDISHRTGRLESDFLEVARRWGTSIECNDEYTQGHCERVADIATTLAAADGLHGQDLFWFRIGALLHDVGKLVLPAGLLNKAAPLSPAEWTVMRTHPEAGVAMLAEIEFPWDIAPIVRSHHERWDGTGYPERLGGEDIPRAARIVCIADVYDALTSARSYKQAISHDMAMAAMRADVGRQFDPSLFTLFEKVAARHSHEWTKEARADRRGRAADGHAPGTSRMTLVPATPLTDACRFRPSGDAIAARA